VARHPLCIDRRNNAFAQVHRIRFRHSCWPPAPAGTLNQNSTDLGEPVHAAEGASRGRTELQTWASALSRASGTSIGSGSALVHRPRIF
jgi:spore germination cell wall hydrolase CwlJ-like protein